MIETRPTPTPPPRAAWRALIVVAAILLPQLVLLGPPLVGARVLLPLNYLAGASVYLPPDPNLPRPSRHDVDLSDLVLQMELFRQYAVGEVRAGRLPLWNPLSYAGSPFIAANQSAVFSPYRLIDYLWPRPQPAAEPIAWGVLVQRVVAGLGAYAFFRRALGVGFAPAVIGAACYPLSGFLILWSGYTIGAVVAWLPWLLLAIDATVRRPMGWGTIGLALATAAALVSGHAATAAQVLLASGAYALWRLWDERRSDVVARADEAGADASGADASGADGASPDAASAGRSRAGPSGAGPGAGAVARRSTARVLLALISGWSLGILLSAPQTLPTLAYMRDSYRLANRAAGAREIPPVGWRALVHLVLPHADGSPVPPAYNLAGYNPLETAPAGYAGLLVTLGFAPFAFADSSHLRRAVFWFALALFAAVPVLGVPGVSRLFTDTPLNLLRNHRFVFVTGFALLCAGVLGLDAMQQRRLRDVADRPRKTTDTVGRLALRAALIAAVILALWNLSRRLAPPAELEQLLARAAGALAAGETLSPPFDSLESLHAMRVWFERTYLVDFALCALAAAILLAGTRSRGWARAAWFVPVVGALAVAELLFIAWGHNPQADPSLYYPKLAALQAVRDASPPGRIVGLRCLPPNLNLAPGLSDVRGYDAADPVRIVELLALMTDPDAPASPSYAVTQWLAPRLPSPVADLLNVRYAIARGPAPPAALATWERVYAGEDYWVLRNPTALPRAYVPRRVEVVSDRDERLRRLGEPSFDPREVAYLESVGEGAVGFPAPDAGTFDGDATIVEDSPSRVVVRADMRTPGVVVLADQWDAGWDVTVDGSPVPLLRANHALRGVYVAGGRSVIEFRYRPASFRMGVWLCALALVVLLAWSGSIVFRARRATRRARRDVVTEVTTPADT